MDALHPDTASLGDVLEVADSLFRGWEAGMSDDLQGTRRREKSYQQVAVTFGLAAHAHNVASAALELIRCDRVLVAMPLVRSVYECSLKAHWVSQAPDAAAAFVNEDLRQRRAHVETLRRTRTLSQFADDMEKQLVESFDTNSSAKQFENICNDLRPGGADAYALYRLLSQLSHATVAVADFYLEPHETSPIALRAFPAEEPSGKSWAFTVACSLVWAGRAVDYLDQRAPRRSELRASARRLGITSELHLTPSAYQRMQRR